MYYFIRIIVLLILFNYNTCVNLVRKSLTTLIKCPIYQCVYIQDIFTYIYMAKVATEENQIKIASR